jgi:hypothetical protein
VIRVPGGQRVAKLVAIVGFITTTLTILLSCVPQPDEANKPLAVLKVVGGSVVLLAIGAWLYWRGKKNSIGLPSASTKSAV